MNPNFFAILALDIANERVRDAQRRHRYQAFLAPDRPNVIRRSVARAAVALSRGSAAVARRLDDRALVSGRSSLA
jgi:hypothetical protein